MASVVITPAEASVRQAVGTEAFLRGRERVKRGEVLEVQWHQQSGRAFGQVGDGERAHSAIATVEADSSGAVTSVRSSCTCSSSSGCPHAVALLLAAMAEEGLGKAPVAPPAAWQRVLDRVVRSGESERAAEPAEVALQFELLVPPADGRAAGRAPGRAPIRIGLRPVVPGRSGWVRTGISWSSLGYSRYVGSSVHARHLGLLENILMLERDGTNRYYGAHSQAVYLDSMPSRRIWDLLAEARELGLPLVQADRQATPVLLAAEPARVSVRVGRSASGLDLDARLAVDSPAGGARGASEIPLDSALLLGEPAHGVAWWRRSDEPERDPRDRTLRLAALAGILDDDLRELLTAGTIRVPGHDEARFLKNYYPALRQRVNVFPDDESVALPEPLPPVLTLSVDHLDGHRAAVAWEWGYSVGEARRREPLWPGPSCAGRDPAGEAEVLGRVGTVIGVVPELLVDSPDGPRLAPAVTLGGIGMIRLINEVLPSLAELPQVRVAVAADGAAPEYREADAPPAVCFAGGEVAGDRDWFDLAVSVSVDGEDVPFTTLFFALARDEKWLILPSGTYFSLEREEFRRLSTLMAEARALQDSPGDVVRLSRFQAGLWEELERIGVVEGQAAAWQESVRSLGSAADLAQQPSPDGLQATLRPYQLAGFNWLAALHAYRLGGVLADDMGLGKTLQALALICHARERGDVRAPFLVVAPTSVVVNWAAETRRFSPGLAVTTVTQTRARRGAALAEAVAGADLVVTSYTLFRLEYEEYEALEWAGLVLDEAQMVKNHQSRGYQCAKRLPAPFKVAMTGTPIENNLMELWSLLSITAPGLFASPARFTDYYRTPIEKDQDGERLDQLRRRIRPLLLRRTKEQVAGDLPDKLEQVLELELNPRHKRIYQTYLQRERQRVLGLLGDLGRNRFEIFRSLTLLRQASLDVALVDPSHAGVASTKLDAMMELVGDVVADGHRTLVFSQFTRFLDAAGRRLDAAGIDYCYLDGSTRDRAAVLTRFREGTAPVFLISLKAGGVGLNLTEADYCILLDPWWNPATEAQAVDRVHRIGQTRKVMVYRLVAKDTIEEKVMRLKAAKAALVSSVLEDGGAGAAALTAADIRGLLETE